MPVKDKSVTDRIVEREDKRLPPSTGLSLRLTRRALLKHVVAAAAAWTIRPWRIGVPLAFGQGVDNPAPTQTLEAYTNTPAMTLTLEAYADTLIPGQKRFPATGQSPAWSAVRARCRGARSR